MVSTAVLHEPSHYCWVVFLYIRQPFKSIVVTGSVLCVGVVINGSVPVGLYICTWCAHV